MKIARIETFLLHPGSGKNLLFCRVETEDGLYGWGEAYVTRGKERVIEVLHPGDGGIRDRPQRLFDPPHRAGAVRGLRHPPRVDGVAVGVECDRDRAVGHPGQAHGRSRSTTCSAAGRASGCASMRTAGRTATTVDENIERALKLKEMGFTAAKFDPFPGPWRSFVDPKDEDFAIDFVRRMREAMGPDFELLIEAHRRFSPSHAIRIGQRLVEFGITWYEEPCLADNIELLAEVRRAVPIPIVTGEALYSKEQFFHALERRAADILNPDICACGGITALMDISAMAQPQAVVMAPHNYNSVLMGLAATVHVCAVIPNFRIAEYFVNFTDICSEVSTTQIEVKDGWAELPTTPGLGVDIDVERLRKHPYKEFAHKPLTEDWEEYPRKGYVPSL